MKPISKNKPLIELSDESLLPTKILYSIVKPQFPGDCSSDLIKALLEKQKRKLLNLSNPEHPTGRDRKGTMTFECHCGTVTTTRVRTYIGSVNGCPTCVKGLSDAILK